MSDPIPMSQDGSSSIQRTQEFDGNDEIGDDDGLQTSKEDAWGRLFSINKFFSSVDLIDDEYSFGRGRNAKIVFDSDELKTSKYFPTYSSVHFKIIRDRKQNCVYLQDLSSNGTFINGEKIGKMNQHILENNAEIALATKNHRVFVYVDLKANEDAAIPAHIREKYIVSRQIGRGTYGEVRLCFLRGTCHRFAMKIVAKKHFADGNPYAQVFNQKIKSECAILQALNHPTIIRIHDVFETDEALYIILELVEGGELFDRIVSHGQFDEKTAKFLFRQMCIGVKYLHDSSITHRDLKPENILLTQPDTNDTLIKITDFGLSRFIREQSLMKTFCGTPNYLAPEVLITHGEGSYTNKVDVWSLGVILFVCLVGYPPFSDVPDPPRLREQIVQGLYSFPREFWSEISDSAKDLVRRMMCVDPNQRLSIDGVLQHPWLNDDPEIVNRVDKLLAPDSPVLGRGPKRSITDSSMSMDAETANALMPDLSSTGANKRRKY